MGSYLKKHHSPWDAYTSTHKSGMPDMLQHCAKVPSYYAFDMSALAQGSFCMLKPSSWTLELLLSLSFTSFADDKGLLGFSWQGHSFRAQTERSQRFCYAGASCAFDADDRINSSCEDTMATEEHDKPSLGGQDHADGLCLSALTRQDNHLVRVRSTDRQTPDGYSLGQEMAVRGLFREDTMATEEHDKPSFGGRDHADGLGDDDLFLSAHILLVEDDARIARLVAQYLHTHRTWRVVTCATVAQASLMLDATIFDVIVLDIMLPDALGTTLFQRPYLPAVLLLSALGQASDRIHGLACGAVDYLVKPFDPQELVLRLDNILRMRTRKRAGGGGGTCMPWHTAVLGALTYDLCARQLRHGQVLIPLTSVQEAVLYALASHAYQLLSRQDLCALALGRDVQLRTIDVQVGRLRRYLNQVGQAVGSEDDPAKTVVSVRAKGYVLRPHRVY